MQVVAVTRVLDEADIIEAFARHAAAYVDHHIFLYNGSTDGTLAILQALHRDGLPLTLLQNAQRVVQRGRASDPTVPPRHT